MYWAYATWYLWRRAHRANPNSSKVERKHDLLYPYGLRTYRAARKCSSHARTIYAEVVEGEVEAHSLRLRREGPQMTRCEHRRRER